MIKEEVFYVDEYTKDLYFRLKEKWPDFEFIFEKKSEYLDPVDYYITIFRDYGYMDFDIAEQFFAHSKREIAKELFKEAYRLYCFYEFHCKDENELVVWKEL